MRFSLPVAPDQILYSSREAKEAGEGAGGPVLRLTAPLSFWGGVDPASGRIINARHPQCGVCLAGTALLIPRTIGSSSSSSVLLELLSAGKGPALLVLGAVDPILLMGVAVAQEMGIASPPVLVLPPAVQDGIPDCNLRLRNGLIFSQNH